METIEFPKLGWVFHIDPVLAEFSIFGLHLSIRWYGVMIALGFLLAVLQDAFAGKSALFDPVSG